MATVSQLKNDSSLCPILSYISIVKIILSYPKTTKSTPINSVLINGKMAEIHSFTLVTHIRSVVDAFGKSDLGFSPDGFGTHSIHSSTAMQLFLNNMPIFQIMLQGRWSSDAFLQYIRRQVNELSKGLSTLMVNTKFLLSPKSKQWTPTTLAQGILPLL